MENMSYFDIIASVIILLLGLKGILNGFFKELFGLIGIIGGIFIASRLGDDVGNYVNNLIFHFQSSAAVSFTGFLLTLAVFWFVMILVGYGFKKLSSLSGLGPVDRILGFVFGAGKFFLIAAVIAFAVYNVKSLKPSIDSVMKNSVLFPVLVATGSFIMKIDPTDVSKNVTSSVQNKVDSAQKAVEEKSQELVTKQIQEIQKEIQQEKH